MYKINFIKKIKIRNIFLVAIFILFFGFFTGPVSAQSDYLGVGSDKECTGSDCNLVEDEEGDGEDSGGNSNDAQQLGEDAAASIAGCIGGGLLGSYLSSFLGGSNVPTTDSEQAKGNWVECVLDSLANVLKRAVVRTLVSSTVEWINNGFEGRPAYGQNISKMMKDTLDGVLGDAIYSTEYLKFLCSDFELPLKFALQLEFASSTTEEFRYRPVCRISDIAENVQGSIDDTVNYYSDLNNIFDINFYGQENIYQTYFALRDEIQKVSDERAGRKTQELDRNKGFFSYRKCKDGGTYKGTKEDEKNCPVTTPGDVLASKLAKATNTEGEELISADEFNEIIGAVLSQLFQKLLMKSGGIRGMSESNSGSGQTGIQQYQDTSNEIEDEVYNQTVGSEIRSSYNAQYPDVAKKTLESMKENLSWAKEFFSTANQCWSGRQSGDISGSGDECVLLSQSTISSMEIIGSWLTEAETRLVDIEEKIRVVNDVKDSYIQLVEQINNAGPGEISAIINEANNDPGISFINNLSELITEKQNLDNLVEERVCGQNSYVGNGQTRRKGTKMSINYCAGFGGSNSSGNSQCTNNSVLFSELNSNQASCNLPNSYDPNEELEQINNTGNNSGSGSSTPAGKCISADGVERTYGDVEPRFYIETDSKCYIYENGQCGIGAKFSESLCQSSHQDSSVYLNSDKIIECTNNNKDVVQINSSDMCPNTGSSSGPFAQDTCTTKDNEVYTEGQEVDRLYFCQQGECDYYRDVMCKVGGGFWSCNGQKYLNNQYVYKTATEDEINRGSCE